MAGKACVCAALILCLTSSAGAAPEYSLLETATMHAAHGNVPAALDAYARLIAREPRNRDAYEARAFFFLKLNRTREALEDFSTIITLFPSYPPAYLSRGLVYSNERDMERAEADFAAACALGDSAGCSFAEKKR